MVSFPSSLAVFFRVPSLTFCDLIVPAVFSVCLFCLLYCCLGMVSKKRGGRGGQGEDAW